MPSLHPTLTISRLGLASRGQDTLTTDDVGHALDRGVNFLNWCGTPDYLSRAVRQLGPRRRTVAVCVQFEARTAQEAEVELQRVLDELGTDHVDVLTFYYVEAADEWRQIASPGGALEFCRAAQQRGLVGRLGLTTHQRPLAAAVARSGLLDLLMVRYNAAHRGAEDEVFPVAQSRGLSIIVYTCLRWGALLQPTPDDPPGFQVPRAPAWYRFALHHPAVTVALTAPASRVELDEALTVLDVSEHLAPDEHQCLAEHGRRVRRHAGMFP